MNTPNNSLSSARALALMLEETQGISREKIQAAHIASIYQSMPRLAEAADDSSLKDILMSIGASKQNNEPVCGVIVETRNHPALETVVLNIAHVCDIPVQLYCGATNLDFILSTRISELLDTGQVVLTELNLDKLETKQYNALLLSQQFWQSMIGRNKILVFQADSLCCQASSYTLADFMHFDYIGARWPRHRPVDLLIDGGNGGFSLRDWGVSMDCLNRFPASSWGGGEDGYYAFHMDLIGAMVASEVDSGKFATQNYFDFNSFGTHAFWHLNQHDQQKFLQYCPQAKLIIPKPSA